MAIAPHIRARVAELRTSLDQHNHNYYVPDQPVISDAEYDRLFRELQQLEQQHPQLVSPESPTQRVGAAPLTDFAQVTHRTPMLSLANAFENDEVVAFDRRVREALDAAAVEDAAGPKIDGPSGRLTHEKRLLTTRATRRGGYTREEVTAHFCT